ncbi:hypothetical protein IPC1300_09825 [Pseudomonas aeruginosa]|nr:hypothetical protein EGY18_28985 [Pseudomonas aeruginosa]OFM74603.1 hypothetical protein HMPREF2666_18340 [Pseudomonas sp. HMSC058C05]OFS97896.1 hypothetical protein HMPREF3141_05935 [Pseudomonas sp. HMSC16B01]AYZ77319.1 hypothetical protein EGY23_13380 [Pseudomonas aeruginosa]KQC61633.1 hypothetical protein APG05_01415 [Pseudomonas aeruginosa]
MLKAQQVRPIQLRANTTCRNSFEGKEKSSFGSIEQSGSLLLALVGLTCPRFGDQEDSGVF